MRVRAQFVVLQVWVALLCAVGAGFSGDLIAHHSAHASHGARHSRGTGHRTRGANRDGVSDHSVEVDLPLTSDAAPPAAEVPSVATVAPQFEFVAWAADLHPAPPRLTDGLALPARGPPLS